MSGRTRTLLALALCLCCHSACTRAADVGFWYAEGALALPDHLAQRLGGALTPAETRAIEARSREELARAFARWRIGFTDSREAYWRIEAVSGLPGKALPGSGAAFTWGLRGWAHVGVAILSSNAIQHAPPGASRVDVVHGIGVGIGRAAAHELAHLIGASMHDRSDPDSYEYVHSNRPSQYYGELHWTVAQPVLDQRLGHAEEVRP